MIEKEHEGIRWLEFELLQGVQGLFHAVTLRNPYSSTYPIPSDCVDLDMIHEDKVVRIDRNNAKIKHIADASSTNISGINLLVTHADCQAAILYDPKNRALTTIHSGWRGSVKNIYAKAIMHMEKEYGSKPKDLLLCIGPSLGPESAEFVNFQSELPQEFLPFQVKKNYFDFWEISKYQALQSGILEKHLEIACLDTVKDSDKFYSWRRDKTLERHHTIAALTLN